MSVALRLSRGGSKKRPFFRIVAADIRSPRDGRYLERLGTYNPMKEKNMGICWIKSSMKLMNIIID